MSITLPQFIERLTQSGLLSAEELAAFQDGLPPEKRPESPQDLARELILAERLTRFQAEAVYRGHTRGLVMGEYTSCWTGSARAGWARCSRLGTGRWTASWP